MVIRDDVEEARRVWLAALEHNRTDPSRAEPWLGSPAAIAARLREYRAIGFRGLNVEVPTPYDFETIERLIKEVKPLVDEQ
jgi:alkanesulfonate monooxygenase SsuD/methylene tetrahydromethanopterin reductase-like flavin-dependent oxidoreductase (luciferase family)